MAASAVAFLQVARRPRCCSSASNSPAVWRRSSVCSLGVPGDRVSRESQRACAQASAATGLRLLPCQRRTAGRGSIPASDEQTVITPAPARKNPPNVRAATIIPNPIANLMGVHTPCPECPRIARQACDGPQPHGGLPWPRWPRTTPFDAANAASKRCTLVL